LEGRFFAPVLVSSGKIKTQDVTPFRGFFSNSGAGIGSTKI
jgi:hypothetical protein